MINTSRSEKITSRSEVEKFPGNLFKMSVLPRKLIVSNLHHMKMTVATPNM